MTRQWLVDRRKVLGKTQREIASEVGISKSLYSEIERGKKNPSLQTALRMSMIMGFDVVNFLDENELLKRSKFA